MSWVDGSIATRVVARNLVWHYFASSMVVQLVLLLKFNEYSFPIRPLKILAGLVA